MSQLESLWTTGSYNNGMAIVNVGIAFVVIGGILDAIGAAMWKK